MKNFTRPSRKRLIVVEILYSCVGRTLDERVGIGIVEHLAHVACNLLHHGIRLIAVEAIVAEFIAVDGYDGECASPVLLLAQDTFHLAVVGDEAGMRPSIVDTLGEFVLVVVLCEGNAVYIDGITPFVVLDLDGDATR